MLRNKLVLATHNLHKKMEMNSILSSLGILIVGLDQFPQIGDIEERKDSKHFSYTNNYSVHPLSRRFYQLDDLYQHGDQNRNHNLLSPPMVDYVNVPITVTHKHPASANMIRKSLQQCENPEKALHDSVKKYLSRIEKLNIPDELSWISPFVEKSRQVFSSIL